MAKKYKTTQATPLTKKNTKKLKRLHIPVTQRSSVNVQATPRKVQLCKQKKGHTKVIPLPWEHLGDKLGFPNNWEVQGWSWMRKFEDSKGKIHGEMGGWEELLLVNLRRQLLCDVSWMLFVQAQSWNTHVLANGWCIFSWNSSIPNDQLSQSLSWSSGMASQPTPT